MSRYATWADEPPIYQKVNALGGVPRPNNAWDQGYNAAIDGALGLIEADLLVNAAADLLASIQEVLALPGNEGMDDRDRWDAEDVADAAWRKVRAAIAKATSK